jgi:tRNA threonylcarbamoyladenosine biosynthesis protein TsaB
VITLGFDTATPSTAVGLRLADGATLQARDDPGQGERPGHATRLLAMAGALLAEAGMSWRALERIAVGLGPGTFTGLRVGVATARGLAQTLAVELVGVSSLRALAQPLGEQERGPVLAVIDARRGEAFAAAYQAGEELISPRPLASRQLGQLALARSDASWRAFGDGAVRFREQLEQAGVSVAEDACPLHRVSARAICDLGVRAEPLTAYEALLPDYCRRPDAEIALEAAAR